MLIKKNKKSMPTKETIIISNFGPISSATINFLDFNVITGLHGEGKTISVQLLIFFKKAPISIFRHLLDKFGNRDFSEDELNIDINDFLEKKFKELVQFDYKCNSSFSISYTWAENDFNITVDGGNFNFSGTIYDKLIEIVRGDTLSSLKNQARMMPAKTNKVEQAQFIANPVTMIVRDGWYKFSRFLPGFQMDVMYITASRTISFIFNRLYDGDDTTIPRHFTEFYNSYKNGLDRFSKNPYGYLKASNVADFERMLKNIVHGELVEENGRFLLKMKDDLKIDLTVLSSGQQEVLPIFVCIFLALTKRQNIIVIVEEPESHLHPIGQAELVKFLAYSAKNLPSFHRFKFILTTHSPFVIDALNNHIYAADLYVKNKKAVSKILPLKYHIDFDSTTAYYLAKGKAKNILNKETRLIEKGGIYDAANTIMSTFSKLVSIDFYASENNTSNGED